MLQIWEIDEKDSDQQLGFSSGTDIVLTSDIKNGQEQQEGKCSNKSG